LAAKPGRTLGDIAILYKDYRAGDIVADAVTTGGFDYIRVDTAAPYRKVALTSWVEDCAAWCAGGWRTGRPQLRGLIDRYLAFHRARLDDACARRKGQELTCCFEHFVPTNILRPILSLRCATVSLIPCWQLNRSF
jgi:DNA helicase-2/ATP-dependent DNA helicase PcrA